MNNILIAIDESLGRKQEEITRLDEIFPHFFLEPSHLHGHMHLRGNISFFNLNLSLLSLPVEQAKQLAMDLATEKWGLIKRVIDTGACIESGYHSSTCALCTIHLAMYSYSSNEPCTTEKYGTCPLYKAGEYCSKKDSLWGKFNQAVMFYRETIEEDPKGFEAMREAATNLYDKLVSLKGDQNESLA